MTDRWMSEKVELVVMFCHSSVADPGFGQGGGQEFFSEILPT